MKPGNLIRLDTEEYTTQFRKLPAKIRDTLKKCVIRSDGKNYYILIGLENTSYVDLRLPLKASLYNLLNLESQFDAMWNRFTAENQSCTEDERLSRRRKNAKAKPCITVAFNLTCKRYNGPLTLYELIDLSDMDPITHDQFEMMGSDAKYVLALLKASTDSKAFRKEWNKYCKVLMASQSIEFLSTVTNRKCVIEEGETMTTLEKTMQAAMDSLIESMAKEEIERRRDEINKEAERRVKEKLKQKKQELKEKEIKLKRAFARVEKEKKAELAQIEKTKKAEIAKANKATEKTSREKEELRNRILRLMYPLLQQGYITEDAVLETCHLSKTAFNKRVKMLNL